MAQGLENRSTRPWLIIILSIVILVIIGAGFVSYRAGFLPRYDRQQAFYAPVFSQDKNSIYYLTRESSGFSWGPGWEFFTPPARVIITHDTFHLERTYLADGRTERLYSLDAPHGRNPQSRYRNRLFGIPYAELNWEGRNLLFHISVYVDRSGNHTNSRRMATVGTWFEHNHEIVLKQKWEDDSRVFVPWNRHILGGNWEVISVNGRAIVLADIDWRRKVGVRTSSTGEMVTQDFLDSLLKEQYSHRESVERNELVKNTRARILQKFRGQGVSESEALLRTSDEMERIGLYPKGPKIIALEAGQQKGGVPVFDISEKEFFVGLFQDIDKAISDPGAEIDFRGNYVRHKDFDTSDKLNVFFKQGGTEFYLKTGGKLYLMKVEKN